MELVEIAVTLFLLVFGYILRELSKMKDKQTEINSRLGVEESKGGNRDKVATQTLELLGKIHHDLSTIKEEQGYWRGRQEGQS